MNMEETDGIERTVQAYIDRYGVEKNLVVLVEELAELQQAVCKYLRCGDRAVIRKSQTEIVADIRSEVTDVLYCLRYLCGITKTDWPAYMTMTADKAADNQRRLEEAVC